MADKPIPPGTPSTPPPEGAGEGRPQEPRGDLREELREDLRRALEREAAEAEAAATLAPEGSGEGRLRLDKSGALIGIEKLKPVRAHARGEGEAGTPAAPPAAAASAARREEAAPTPAPTPAPAPAAPPGAPRRAVLPPRIGTYVPPGFPGSQAGGDEVEIPAGSFLYGEDRQSRTLAAFRIDRLPVTHGDYERFVRETGHRPPLYWPAGHLPEDLRDHPVVGVDYFDALAYARWAGKDLPFEDEWERAARGTDGRSWPWGDNGDLPHSNTARAGYKMTLPVGFFAENESPDGVKDLVGNTWELTHSPAPGGGVVVRGGSWFDFAFHAKTWFRFAARPTARNGTIGFRCVRRAAPRTDAPREVDPNVVDAEIAARQGPQPPIDPSQFSADRRDLVPDIRRLRVLLAERQVTEAVAVAARAPVPPPPAPRVAAPPPPPPPTVTPRPAAAAPAAPKPAPPPAPAPKPPPAAAPAPAPVAAAPAAPPAAPVAARPTPPEPAPAPKKEAPLHVPLPTGSMASQAAAAAAALPAPPAPEAPPPVPPPPPPAPPSLEQLAARNTPPAMWVLLAVCFAVLLGVLTWLLVSGSRKDEPTTPPEVPTPGPTQPAPPEPRPAPDELADLPPAPAPGAGPLDGQPARLLDGASGTWRERLGAGAWLLVFAGGPDEAAARETRESALDLHRRYAGTGLNVALVVPRAAFEQGDGTLVDPAQLDLRLRDLAARDGMTVLLDPRHDQRAAIRESRYGLSEANAALLLVDGQVEVLTQPPTGPMGLKHLGRIAERARAWLGGAPR